MCDELGPIQHLWFKFGVQLGIPHSKLKEFEKEQDPLAAAVDDWLRGNAEGVTISWKSVAEALESSHVGERGLAKIIRMAHCYNEDGGKRNGKHYRVTNIPW